MRTLFTQGHLLQLQEYSDHIKSRIYEYFIGFYFFFFFLEPRGSLLAHLGVPKTGKI